MPLVDIICLECGKQSEELVNCVCCVIDDCECGGKRERIFNLDCHVDKYKLNKFAASFKN